MVRHAQLVMIRELREDARRSLSLMSRRQGIPVTTLFDNYGKLLHRKIIRRHVTLLDLNSMGCSRAMLLLRARSRDEMISFLRSAEVVNSLYRISEYDVLADLVFRAMSDLEDLLDCLVDFGIARLEVFHVDEVVTCERFMP